MTLKDESQAKYIERSTIKTKSTPAATKANKVTKPRTVKKKSEGAIAKAPAKRPRKKPEPSQKEIIHEQARKAARYALEKKAEEIHVLDLAGITSMTDYFIVATGSSDRQVKAIAENVVSEMRDTEGVQAWKSEGWDGLQWVIIDFVDFVVHVFQSEARKFYNIERLWADAPMEVITDEEAHDRSAKKPKAPRTRKAVAKPASKSGIRIISDFKHVN